MIQLHDTPAELLADPATIREALALLAALERMEIILTVDGTVHRGVIRFAEENAVLAIDLTT